MNTHCPQNSSFFLALACGLCGLVLATSAAIAQTPPQACRIMVVDADSNWPVPLVELKTTNGVRFVSDNAGLIAMDDMSLMDREVWFSVMGHGYGVPADGFGFRGIRLTPRAGETRTVRVQRNIVAKRLGRLTGAGMFAESQKLGEALDWPQEPIVGCDSVQNAVHNGKMFWSWGDTTVASYPLGIFDMTAATTSLRPFDSFEPPLRPRFDYYQNEDGKPRGVAKMPGEGPTWLTGFASLPDAQGTNRLVACYRKIRGHLEVYEAGQCVWDEDSQQFQHHQTLWKISDNQPMPATVVEGHAAFWNDEQGRDDRGQRWLLFGNPLPHVRVPATYEAWQDTSQWEALTPQRMLISAQDGSEVEPHSGSIAWNAFRGRWVTVFMQKFGKPSAFGTLWYAESDAPTGPWGKAVEILSHDNYTFYNPRLHPEFTPAEEPILLFEGTYTAEFADRPEPTPRYNYNQILYRLDLDDPALEGAK